MTTNLHDKMLAAIDALFSASDAVEEEAAENLLLDVRDEINKHKGKELLHKLAAKSLTEGLRLDDWNKIGCVNHDCDKCKALAEQPAQSTADKSELETVPAKGGLLPAQQDIPDLIAGALGVSRGTAYDMMREALAEQSAQQEPVAWIYSQGKSKVVSMNRVPGVRATPLYTTPQPPAQPLTVKEIAEFVGTHEYGPEQLKWFRLGEAAHGITKGNT